jgi:hypothetical protein
MATGDTIRTRHEPVVGPWMVISDPPDTRQLVPDGPHPSLDCQLAIMRALVGKLASTDRSER